MRGLFKFVILAAVAAMLCGLLHAVPLIGVAPPPEALLAAARGLAWQEGTRDFGGAHLFDSLAAWLWQTGGAAALGGGLAATVFVVWAVGAFLVLLGTGALARLIRHKLTSRVLMAAALVLVFLTCIPVLKERARGGATSDLRLVAPVDLAAKLKAIPQANAFVNASAVLMVNLLVPGTPDMLPPLESARLVADPAAWREAMRGRHWNAVVLSGPASEYRTLLDHLMVSPDWRLAGITNFGFLFVREPRISDSPAPPEPSRLGNDQDTAVYLAQVCGYYDAVRRTREARAFSDRALALAPDNLTVLCHAATFAVAHKKWHDALTWSERALKKQPDLTHAMLIRAMALLETGDPAQARKFADAVVARSPSDLYTLFLSARIAKALRDPEREAEILERIVAINKEAGLPNANYQIYLGQAYARQSLAQPALENYRAAIESGQLDAQQSASVRDAISAIESKTAH